MMLRRNRHHHPDREDETLRRVRLNEAVTHIAFAGGGHRVLRPGGALLAADFRPSWRRHSPHSRASTSRHGGAVPLGDLARAAGFRLEDHGDLPLLRYVRAVRPDDT
jgi:hypothetical protein